jgi:hypothetical protein
VAERKGSAGNAKPPAKPPAKARPKAAAPAKEKPAAKRAKPVAKEKPAAKRVKPVAKAKPAVKAPAKATTLHVDSHRALVGKQRKIVKALEAHPDLLPLLAVNPLEAFHEAGITFSPKMADHVVDTIHLPPRLREERDQLRDMLTEALGEDPRPTSPTWLVRALFRLLDVTPLNTTGREPVYRSTIDAQAADRLAALIKPYHRAESRAAGVPITPSRRSVGLLDLDAPVPDLPAAAKQPAQVTLPELWFYRDAHELVRPLLRLGIIYSSGIRVVPKAAYRRIREGKQRNQLASWVRSVTFAKDSPDR